MIDENGNYHCDYCGGGLGEHYTATGNHVVCEDSAKLRSALERIEEAGREKNYLLMLVIARAALGYSNTFGIKAAE